MRPVEERFLEKVSKEGPLPSQRPELGSCWLWIANRGGNGYGQFWLDRKLVPAHRLAHELWVGPIPQGSIVDHLCGVLACVRPSHLQAVTVAENNRRGNGMAGRNSRKTQCPQGHPYDFVDSAGRRWCRICKRMSDRASRQRLRRERADRTPNRLGVDVPTVEPTERMRKTGYFLTVEQHRWLADRARERRVSASQVLREVLDGTIAATPRPAHPARRAEDVR